MGLQVFDNEHYVFLARLVMSGSLGHPDDFNGKPSPLPIWDDHKGEDDYPGRPAQGWPPAAATAPKNGNTSFDASQVSQLSAKVQKMEGDQLARREAACEQRERQQQHSPPPRLSPPPPPPPQPQQQSTVNGMHVQNLDSFAASLALEVETLLLETPSEFDALLTECGLGAALRIRIRREYVKREA